ncbi:MAG: hypothetical protein AAGI69_24140 [Cyanobacteria bacterium P01_H01_bin.21]
MRLLTVTLFPMEIPQYPPGDYDGNARLGLVRSHGGIYRQTRYGSAQSVISR